MAKKMLFEEGIGKIEEIVRVLDEGNLPLEEAVKAYEEGMELCSYCGGIIEKCEQKIISINMKDGSEEEILR